MTSSGNNWAEELIQQETYSPGELAELLDIDEALITQEVHKGNLRGNKIGSDVVDIPRSAVLEWLDQRERGRQ